jgi:general stress protein 26
MTQASQTDADGRKKLYQLIEGIHVAMLTTVDEDGSLHARPMGNNQPKHRDDDREVGDNALLFLSRASAHKAIELGHDARVSVTFADPSSQTYISVSGKASISRDRARAEAIWSAWAKVWFPGGLDDSDLAVLTVTIDKAEYWDSPSGTFVLLYGLATQALTGHPPHLGENRKIAF